MKHYWTSSTQFNTLWNTSYIQNYPYFIRTLTIDVRIIPRSVDGTNNCLRSRTVVEFASAKTAVDHRCTICVAASSLRYDGCRVGITRCFVLRRRIGGAVDIFGHSQTLMISVTGISLVTASRAVPDKRNALNRYINLHCWIHALLAAWSNK